MHSHKHASATGSLQQGSTFLFLVYGKSSKTVVHSALFSKASGAGIGHTVTSCSRDYRKEVQSYSKPRFCNVQLADEIMLLMLISIMSHIMILHMRWY